MCKKFVTKTVSDILSTVMEPKEKIVQDLIPQGICILAGPQKVGKSFLALDISVSVALGRPVLGRETVQGECLYLGLEDTYLRLQHRLLCMDVENTDFLHFAIAADKLGGGLENQINDFSKDHPNLRLVVIDVMQRVRKKATANYNAEYNELAELRNLANELGICVLMVMHTRKSRDRDPINNIYGGGGFVASADAISILSKERSQSYGKILCTGREIENIELSVTFDSETMRWLVVNDPAYKEKKGKKVLAAVYLYIRKKIHFEGSPTELIEELKSVTSEKFYPNRITRDLLEEGYKLIDYGIMFAVKRQHNGRLIILHYIEANDQCDSSVTKGLPID